WSSDVCSSDLRIDRTLAARTHAELGAVAADLPSRTAPGSEAPGVTGRFQVAYKNSVCRGGRWRLPARFTTLVYKGTGILDLRSAELDGPSATLRVFAYKSTVEIIVPPGIRVEADGVGVSTNVHGIPPAGAPVVHIRGYAYKGTIEVKDRIRLL